jgi:predicted ATPase
VLPAKDDPGADFEVVVRKGDIPIDVLSLAMARRAAVDRKDIPPVIPIDRLSSGEIALFAFAGPLIFRDAPADVVLIDEPEQHMHVQWQAALVRALRELSPESQLIVATHSLDILDLASSYERHLLLRSDDPRAQDAAQ